MGGGPRSGGNGYACATCARPQDRGMASVVAQVAALITSFERRLQARICVYDYVGTVRPWLPPDRTFHGNPLCRHVIRQGAPCTAFDRLEVERRLCLHPQGFFKRCHARIVEHVTPLTVGGVLVGAILCGQYT